MSLKIFENVKLEFKNREVVNINENGFLEE